MERMLIKHLSGSKANQVEEFAIKHHSELIFGRDLTATVKYDPDRDDLVGRQHAKLSRDPNNKDGFHLTDLNSTNGTFLNGQRITGAVKLSPEDRVQFGAGGPEFVFDVEPRPTEQMRTTRAAESSPADIRSTRVAPTGSGSGDIKPPGAVGKATVERMVSQAVEETKRSQGRKFGTMGAMGLALVLLMVVGLLAGGYWYFNKVSGRTADLEKKTAGMSSSEINAQYSKSVVQVFDAWRLLNTAEQSQAYHAWVYPEGGGNPVPLYVQMPSGKIEPVLRYKKQLDEDKPIGGTVTGTGFIVTNDGFVLTSRSVAAPWMSPYKFDKEKYPRPGILLASNYVTVINTNQAPPQDWVPENSEQTKPVDLTFKTKKKKDSFAILTANFLRGTNDVLEVTLPGKDAPIAAQLNQKSDRHNVAQIRVNIPGELTRVETFDSYETLSKGDTVTILGYSDASAPEYGVIESKDASNPGTRMRQIPNPTVITTNISNISRDVESKNDRRVSVLGDVFQLASGAGPGASGSPIFDSQGRVIGIFILGDEPNEFFAVPIRYSKDFSGS